MIWDAIQALDPDKMDDSKDLLASSMKAGQLAEVDGPSEEIAGRLNMCYSLNAQATYLSPEKTFKGFSAAFCQWDLNFIDTLGIMPGILDTVSGRHCVSQSDFEKVQMLDWKQMTRLMKVSQQEVMPALSSAPALQATQKGTNIGLIISPIRCYQP